MAWLFMVAIGALFAGLVLGLKDLLPYLAARRRGAISRRGARRVVVRRDEDAEAFARLLRNRARGAGFGFSLAMAGVLVLSLFGLAATGFATPLALLELAVFIGLGLFAVVCLVRGLVTGRMFAFWSLMLFGEATRRQAPGFYWLYAMLNLLIVLGFIASVIQTGVG